MSATNGAEEQAPGRVIVIVGQGGVQTDLDLDTLGDDEVADVIPDLLADYSAECRDWTLVAGEHWRKSRWGRAQDLLRKGLQFFGGGSGRARDHMALANLHAMLAHLHLALARTAPKVSLPHAKYDKLPAGMKTKEDHYTEAAANLNGADQALLGAGAGPDDEPVAVAMGKIILYLARGQPQTAQPLVERLLRRQPNNIMALTAQARLQFARRAHEQALQTYQKMLSINPEMNPDPRIGIGLCLWALGDRAKAKAAWERALQRDPSSWTCMLLLGFAILNTSREPATSDEDRAQLQAEGAAYVQAGFKLNNKNAAAALALAGVSGANGQTAVASKLAERAIQYADNKRHVVAANTERGRLGFIMKDLVDATPFLTAARQAEAGAANILADLTAAQMAIQAGNLREALNFMDGLTPRIVGKGPMEYVVMHASLLAYPHPGMSSSELAANRAKARSMLSELHGVVESAVTEEDIAKVKHIADDPDVFLDLAKMWQKESLEKTISAYQTAVTAQSDKAGANLDDAANGDTPPDQRAIRMSSNLGTLFQLQGSVDTAERMYQEALQKLGADTSKDAEATRTIMAFNLGRAYEDGGEVVKASQWYRDVLRQHPEHMESKIRLAALAAAAGRNVDAHNLLKECLKADENNLALRSTYTHFLISIGSYKEALAFTSQTLKIERADVFTYCALGWLHFTLGREAKSPQEVAERTKQYLRSAEAYERALTIDPSCATAAQGLAIALAEDTLALKPQGAAVIDDPKNRMRLAGQALGIFSRIADSLADGSVNVNIGHCYFARGEEEKAIQSYEAADNVYQGRNVPNLLYLARAWYAYANRESNFTAMSRALSYCQKAMHLQPSDRAVLYNIAMIQQKSAELLFALDPSKRTLAELQTALQQAQQAAATFRTLASDTAHQQPYDPDLADQRARYGDTLLRRAPEQLSKQEAYEAEEQARVEQARKVRAEEQARIAAAEEQRRKEIEAKAAELAEQRRRAREEALAWQEELNARIAEEEARKASSLEKRKRKKEPGVSDDEGVATPRERKPRKGKKGRKVRSKSEILSDEEPEYQEGMENELVPAGDADDDDVDVEGDGVKEEVDEESVRKEKARGALAALRAKAKKKRGEDPDDEPDEPRRGGKQFKSKAFIEDSDEDEDEGEAEVAKEEPETAIAKEEEDDDGDVDMAPEAHAPAPRDDDDDDDE